MDCLNNSFFESGGCSKIMTKLLDLPPGVFSTLCFQTLPNANRITPIIIVRAITTSKMVSINSIHSLYFCRNRQEENPDYAYGYNWMGGSSKPIYHTLPPSNLQPPAKTFQKPSCSLTISIIRHTALFILFAFVSAKP